MRLSRLISYVVTSVLARFMVAGVILLVLRFGPWGNVFKQLGFLSNEPSVSEQFEQVAEALEYGESYGGGYDPYLGPTGVSSYSSSYEPPKKSEESPLAALKRKLGFGDRAVRAPEWVPIFTGAIDKGTIVQKTAEGEKRIVRAEVPAMGSSIVSFYERAFAQMGYPFTNEQNGTETNLAAESPDGARTITVAISARGARSTLVLTHLERPRPAAP